MICLIVRCSVLIIALFVVAPSYAGGGKGKHAGALGHINSLSPHTTVSSRGQPSLFAGAGAAAAVAGGHTPTKMQALKLHCFKKLICAKFCMHP